jgi:AcrR family transcriptional regulator
MLTKKTRVSRRGRPHKQSPPQPRKEPLQQRSRETVLVILEAAARILEQHGLAGYNTNAIADRAGVSIGSIYQYFPNKDALTIALIAQFEQRLIESVKRAMASTKGKSLRHSLQLVVRELLRIHHSRTSLHRLLELEEDRLLQNQRPIDEMQTLPRFITSLLSSHRTELKIRVNSATIQDVITIVRAMVNATLMSATPPKEAERRILRALEGYLLY